MIQTITPDLLFQASFEKIFTETFIGALIFPTGFFLGKYILLIRKNNSEVQNESLINFLSQNIPYFLVSILFLFIIRLWYSLNKIKRISGIHYNSQTGLIAIEYKNLLGGQVRKEIIRREDLRFQLNASKREAAISNKLTQTFLLNTKTGFSLEKLLALQHLISSEGNYV